MRLDYKNRESMRNCRSKESDLDRIFWYVTRAHGCTHDKSLLQMDASNAH